MVESKIPEGARIPLKHARILKGPYQIAMDITNRCNYRCLHCYNRSGENPTIDNELTDKEKIEVIKDIAKLKPYNFCFCGGEPMIVEKILYEGAKILSSNGIMVSMVTNGSLITKENAKKLLKSGIKRTQVSLDGATPETHEKLRQHKNAFEYATNAIKYFKQAKGYLEIGVAFSPTSFNWFELEDTYKLAVKLGANNFRVQPLMILGRARKEQKWIFPTPIQYREMVRTIQRLRKENNINIEWGDPIDHLIRFRTKLEHFTPFTNIQANGNIVASPYIPISIGNVKKYPFSKYWDAGLVRAWETPKIKELASRIISIEDMGKSEEGIPIVWYEKNFELDLIDDNLTKGGM